MTKMFTAAICFAAIIIIVSLLAITIYDSRRCDEYRKYSKKAQDNFGLTKDDFKKYINFAKALYGVKRLYRNAYLIAEEEWYDEHYK